MKGVKDVPEVPFLYALSAEPFVVGEGKKEKRRNRRNPELKLILQAEWETKLNFHQTFLSSMTNPIILILFFRHVDAETHVACYRRLYFEMPQ